MTGERFEHEFCEILSKMGFWALRIPRSNNGSQPFDVISVGDKIVNAFDCKVCKSNRFPLDRIEDNQWLAFEAIERKTKHHAFAGLAILHNGNIYRVAHFDLKAAQREGQKSLDLSRIKPWLTSLEIRSRFGKTLT